MSNRTIAFSFIVLTLLSLNGAGIQAPDEEWNRTYGGDYDEHSYSGQQTRDGGYIIVGETNSFGEGGYDSSDVYLIKTDAEGNELWEQTFGGNYDDVGFSVKQTKDGGYIIVGIYDWGDDNSDVWLIKTDAEGNELWNQTFGGSYPDGGVSVQQTIDGGYILTGSRSLDANYTTVAWLIKTDIEGNLLWTQTFDNDEATCVRQTSDGGYILTGATHSGWLDVWLMKTDADGIKLWERSFGGSLEDLGFSVLQTKDGGYIIIGGLASPGIEEYSAYYSLWLIKTDAEGNKAWEKTIELQSSPGLSYHPDIIGLAVYQTKDGGYILLGISGNGYWLFKTDADGNEIWHKSFFRLISTPPPGDEGFGRWVSLSGEILQTKDGGYILMGDLYDGDSSDFDIWLIKVKGDDAVRVGSTAQEEEPSQEVPSDGGGDITLLTSSNILPRSGGMLEVVSDDDELNGVSLEVLPFAIGRSVNISIGTQTEMPSGSPFGQSPVGKLISIEPSSQTFNESARLTLPIPAGEEAEGLYIGLWNEDLGVWENLGGMVNGNFISTNLTHLSLYGLFYSGKSTVKIVNEQQLDTTDIPITVAYIAGPVPPEDTPDESPFRATRPLPPGGIELARGESAIMELLPGRYHFVVGYPRPSPSVANSMWFTVPFLTEGADDSQVDQTITIIDYGVKGTDLATGESMIFPGRTVSETTNLRPAIDIDAVVPDGVPKTIVPGPSSSSTPPGISSLETGTKAALDIGPIKVEQLEEAITLSAVATDPEGDELKYYWTIKDSTSGKAIVDSGITSSGSTLIQEFSADRAGTYIVYLTIYDEYGLFNEGRWTISVVPNGKPFVEVVVDDKVIGFGRLDEQRRSNGLGPDAVAAPNHIQPFTNIKFGNPSIPDWGVYDRDIEIGAITAMKDLAIRPDHTNPDQNPDGMTSVYAIVADSDQDPIKAEFVLPVPIFGRGNFYAAIPLPNESDPVSNIIKLSDGRTLSEAYPEGYPSGAIIDNYQVMDAYSALLSQYANRGWLPSQPTNTEEFPYVIGFSEGSGEIRPGDVVTEAPLGGVTPEGTVTQVILSDGSWSLGNAKGYLLMAPATDFWDWRNSDADPALFVNEVEKARVSYVGQVLPIIWEAPDDPCIEGVCHDASEAGETQLPRGGTINIEARVNDPFSPQERDFGLVEYRTDAKGTLTDEGWLTGTGDVQVTLKWYANADIDLYVEDPNGDTVYYENKYVPSGGYLDLDNMCGNLEIGKPENIYWPEGEAPSGTYTVSVNYFADCSESDYCWGEECDTSEPTSPVNWEVVTTVSGEMKSYSGTLNEVGETQEVTNFEIG